LEKTDSLPQFIMYLLVFCNGKHDVDLRPITVNNQSPLQYSLQTLLSQTAKPAVSRIPDREQSRQIKMSIGQTERQRLQNIWKSELEKLMWRAGFRWRKMEATANW